MEKDSGSQKNSVPLPEDLALWLHTLGSISIFSTSELGKN